MPADVAVQWRDCVHESCDNWGLEREVRRRAASRALRRLTAELERLRRKFGHVDYARLVRAPTAEWVAGEDALLDTLICKREALLICETLDLHLVTAAVTGDMRLAWGTNGGRGGLLHRLNALKSGMRYGDVDTGPGAPPRRWGEAPGDRDVVWWRARWRCGCCEGPGQDQGARPTPALLARLSACKAGSTGDADTWGVDDWEGDEDGAWSAASGYWGRRCPPC